MNFSLLAAALRKQAHLFDETIVEVVLSLCGLVDHGLSGSIINITAFEVLVIQERALWGKVPVAAQTSFLQILVNCLFASFDPQARETNLTIIRQLRFCSWLLPLLYPHPPPSSHKHTNNNNNNNNNHNTGSFFPRQPSPRSSSQQQQQQQHNTHSLAFLSDDLLTHAITLIRLLITASIEEDLSKNIQVNPGGTSVTTQPNDNNSVNVGYELRVIADFILQLPCRPPSFSPSAVAFLSFDSTTSSTSSSSTTAAATTTSSTTTTTTTPTPTHKHTDPHTQKLEQRGRALRKHLVESLLDLLLSLKTKAHVSLFVQYISPAPFLLAVIQQPLQQVRYVFCLFVCLFFCLNLV